MSNLANYGVFRYFPVIVLDDIILRALDVSDYQEFFTYMNHPLVKKYLADNDIPLSLEHAQQELSYWSNLFHRSQSIYWGIALKDSNKLIGSCGFNHWHKTQNRAEISYDLSPQHWGKGIMTRAIQAVTDFALNDMKVNRVQATIVYDNVASMRVLEKNQYLCEGILRKYTVLAQQVVDSHMYAKVK